MKSTQQLEAYLRKAFDGDHRIAIQALCVAYEGYSNGESQFLSVIADNPQQAEELMIRLKEGVLNAFSQRIEIIKANEDAEYWEKIEKNSQSLVLFNEPSELTTPLGYRLPREYSGTNTRKVSSVNFWNNLEQGFIDNFRDQKKIDTSKTIFVWIPKLLKIRNHTQYNSYDDVRPDTTAILKDVATSDDYSTNREYDYRFLRLQREGHLVWMDINPVSHIVKNAKKIQNEKRIGNRPIIFDGDCPAIMALIETGRPIISNDGISKNYDRLINCVDGYFETKTDYSNTSITITSGKTNGSCQNWYNNQLSQQNVRVLVKNNYSSVKKLLDHILPEGNIDIIELKSFKDLRTVKAPDLIIFSPGKDDCQISALNGINRVSMEYKAVPLVLFNQFKLPQNKEEKKGVNHCYVDLRLDAKNKTDEARYGLKKLIKNVQRAKLFKKLGHAKVSLPGLQMVKQGEKSYEFELLEPEVKHELLHVPKDKALKSDVVGLEKIWEEMRNIWESILNPKIFLDHKLSPRSGLFLVGKSGCGKTHLVETFANYYNIPLLKRTAERLISKKERNVFDDNKYKSCLEEIFNAAKVYSPCILFIDEFQVLIKDRNENSASRLLDEMDKLRKEGSQIFVIGATNYADRVSLSNEAFYRYGRFGKPIKMNPPNAESRKKMFLNAFPYLFSSDERKSDLQRLTDRTTGSNPSELMEIFTIACEYNCRDLEGLNLNQRSNRISVNHVHNAIDKYYYGDYSAPKKQSEKDLILTAWHEAGHALMLYLRFPKKKIDILTIEPSGNSMGYVAEIKDETSANLSKEDVKDRIDILLAGREAELLSDVMQRRKSEIINSGASSDLRAATRLARKYVTEWGMDNGKNGLSNSVLTLDWEDSNKRLPKRLQDRVEKLLRKRKKKTVKLLRKNRSQLERLAKCLHENITLHHDEIKSVLDAS